MCNSTLGSRVDGALIDFLPIRVRRGQLGLAGRGEAPSPFDILLGDHQILGLTAKKIRTTLDRRTGKLDHHQLYHAEDVVLPDGRKVRQITLDPFLWLGESYLDDPSAKRLRQAICGEDLASTDELPGYVDEAEPCTAFRFWTPHTAHHLAYATVLPNAIVVAARVFDLYAVAIPVSTDPTRYVLSPSDAEKLRFLAIDSISGKTVNTAF